MTIDKFKYEYIKIKNIFLLFYLFKEQGFYAIYGRFVRKGQLFYMM